MSINAWRSQKLGYGRDSRLKIKVSVRDLPYLRDPAVIMIDQMKQVYIDGDLERSILRIGFRRSCARITSSASPAPEVGPTPTRISNCFYGCGGELNYNGYCSPEVDKLIDWQSSEADQEKRKRVVWGIERKLAEDGARPTIFYDRRATCWEPRVTGLTLMVHSIFNGWRMEDVWLDK